MGDARTTSQLTPGGAVGPYSVLANNKRPDAMSMPVTMKKSTILVIIILVIIINRLLPSYVPCEPTEKSVPSGTAMFDRDFGRQ